MKSTQSTHLIRGGASLFALGSLIVLPPQLSAAESLLFSESFETDGADTRYIVENRSDDGSNDYNDRRQIGSPGTRVRGNIDGDWFWGLRDLDAEGEAVNDLNDDEGRITWTESIDITNVGNLRLAVTAAQGGDEQEWDNVVAFQIRIDGGDWINIGGFRGRHTNSPSHYFQGDLRTFPDRTDPRLNQQFSDWSWDVYLTGSTAEVRMFTNMNGGSEEVAFDNLRLFGDDAVDFATFAVSSSTFAEDAGTGTITITLPAAAPAGGVTFMVENTDTDGDEVMLPEMITVPEGQTMVMTNFPIIADGRFDGDELVIVRFSAPGYARDQVRFTVTNIDAKPNVIINEFLPVLNDLEDNVPAEDLPLYDVNGDGRTDEDEEQFIEIVNLEDVPVDISGWTVNDELQIRHIFPEGTILPPGGVILVFADAVPVGVFGGAIVQVTELVSPNFDEDGDIAQIVAGGAVVDAIAYTGDLGETYDSITRFPDLTGTTEGVQDHTTIPEANGALWSPGTKVDGSYFADYVGKLNVGFSNGGVVGEGNSISITLQSQQLDGSGPLEVSEAVEVSIIATGPDGDEVMVAPTFTLQPGFASGATQISGVSDLILDGDRVVNIRVEAAGYLPDVEPITVVDAEADPYNLIINEAFGDVLGSGADANQNGELEEPVADQFIEIVNAGDADVDLTAWSLVSWRTSQPGGPQTVHIFPATTILPAGGSIVVFGSGDADTLQGLSATFFGGAIIQVANNHGNGVNVTAEGEDGEITLYTPGGYPEDQVIFGDDATEQDQALTRNPDLTGDFGALHLEASSAFELASPGRQLDGLGFAGNGVVTGITSPRGFFTDTIELNSGWWFNSELGYLWTEAGIFPFFYILGHENWIWAWIFPGVTEATGYYIYDYEAAQFGFTGPEVYPNYLIEPGGTVPYSLVP
jgi:hypothetical protein